MQTYCDWEYVPVYLFNFNKNKHSVMTSRENNKPKGEVELQYSTLEQLLIAKIPAADQ